MADVDNKHQLFALGFGSVSKSDLPRIPLKVIILYGCPAHGPLETMGKPSNFGSTSFLDPPVPVAS